MQAYESYLFRPANLHDFDTLFAFAQVAGLTNLPPNRTLLEANIQRSIQSFATPRTRPQSNDFYLFVLEHLPTHTIVGCSGIYAEVGTDSPFYTFHHDKLDHTLHLDQRIHHVSEMVALYLSHDARQKNLGALLSRARYLWMATQPQRFHDHVIAEMRGRIDKADEKPFWSEFAHQFFPASHFNDVDLAVAAHHTRFIEASIPASPISIDTLSKRAEACIGITHISTRAAMLFLEKEGFMKTDEINVFDGGPILKAKVRTLRTIRQAEQKRFAGTRSCTEGPYFLVSTTQHPFTVSLTQLHRDDHACYLPAYVAQNMRLHINDTLCVSVF